MKVLEAISVLFSVVLFSIGTFAQSQRMAHINVRNDQHTEVITNNLSDQKIDDGYIVVIPGGRDRDSLVVCPEEKYAVGKIPYTSNVDANGKVCMHIPLADYASSYELSPNLSLDYDGGSNLFDYLGYGWRLNGVSVIEKTVSDYFTDGNVDRFSSDSLAALSLDGMRLVRQSDGSYLSQAGETRARWTGESSIKVLYADGSVALFSCEDGHPSKEGRLRYYIRERQSLDGQKISYTYRKNSNHYLFGGRMFIDAISFGDGREIKFRFNHKNRVDAHLDAVGSRLNRDLSATRYEKGMTYNYYFKLDTIDVTQGGRLLSRYEISYADQRIESPVSIIRKIGADGASLKPLRLSYGNTDNISSWQKKTYKLGSYLSTSNLSNLSFRTGKFDGGNEGEGIMMFPKKDTYLNSNSQSFFFKSSYTAKDTLVLTISSPSAGTAIPCGKIGLDNSFVEALAVDTDGDGDDEVVTISETCLKSDGSALRLKVYRRGGVLGDRNYSMSQTHSFVIPCESALLPKSFLHGDFDGDGREEILAISHQISNRGATVRVIDVGDGTVKASFPVGSCFVAFPESANASDARRGKDYWDSDRIFATDYNADGKPELCVMTKSGLKFHSFRFSDKDKLVMDTFTAPTNSYGCTNILNTDSLYGIEIVPGDFNGDGCTDFIIPASGLYTASMGWAGIANAAVAYSVILGNGNGRFFEANGGKVNIGVVRDGVPDNTLRQVQVADINRDGVTDVIFELQRGNTVKTVALTFRNGVGWYNTEGLAFNADDMLIPCFPFGSVARDNHAMTVLSPNGTLSYCKLAAPADFERCLTSINDYQGNTHTFSYARTYRATDFPVTSPPTKFPFAPWADGRLVCVREEQKAKNTLIADISYRYKCPVTHLQGLGFCGFREVTASDCVSGRETIMSFSPEKLGTPIKTETMGNGEHLKTDAYGYDLRTDDGRHIQKLLRAHTADDHLTGVSVKRTLNYDGFGNIVRDTVAYGDDGVTVSSFSYRNIVSDTLCLIGLVSESHKTAKRGKSTVENGETIEFNPHFLPSKAISWTGTAKQPVKTTTYSYDTKCRLTRTETVPYSGSPLQSVWKYSASNRRPREITDEDGIITAYKYGGYGVTATYDQTDFSISSSGSAEIKPGIGLCDLADITAPRIDIGEEAHGPATLYHYDELGVVDSVTCAYGGGVKYVREWAEDGDSASYVITVKEDSEPVRKTWYDGLDRIKREGVQRPDGSFLLTECSYDSRGLLCAKSEPYRSASSLWTRYAYDDAGRLIRTDHPDGHSDSWLYEGLTTTSIVGGQEKRTTSDAMGLVTAVEDGHGGGSRTEYSYRADGKPEHVTTGGFIYTFFEYDDYGRQTAINDPSAGRRERAYDASGRIACETDARGKSVSCTYDDKGRIIRRVIDNGTIFEYTYDRHSNLIEMKTNGVVTRTYTYDEHSRLISMTESDYSKMWAYDGKNVESVAYFLNNSQICKEQYSRTLGTTTTVTINNGAQVWRLIGEDEKGRPTNIGFGSLTQQLSFDLAGRVTGRKVRYGNEPYIQNAAYEYDEATGNMTMRTDSIYGHEEAFAYDHLNRLCEAGSDSYAYDTKGNMARRSGVGDYAYDVARPFAVSQVPFNAMIPQREQFISYNALQQPDSIIEGSATATFTYGADLQRSSMRISRHGNAITTRYYDGSYNSVERKQGCAILRKQILYLAGDAYTAPAAIVRDYGSSSWQLRHIIRDNQNSIVAVTDTAGNVLERNSYDPWGVRRDPASLTPYAPGEEPELLFGRGYGSHEHLGDFGLINMNARLYDPTLCRFLSPDPVVQSPFTPQNLNRYAFCLNNPLRYTDPSGMFTKTHINGDMHISLDDVYVIGTITIPNPWLQYYGQILPRVQYNVFYGNKPLETAPDNSLPIGKLKADINTPKDVSFLAVTNTSVSLPINIVKQHWTRVLKTEATQIDALQQCLATTPSAETERLLQSKSAQYKALEKPYSQLSKLGKTLTITGFITTGVDVYCDFEKGHYKSMGARTVVAAATYASSFIPIVGPVVSVGLGLADALWGEQFYNWLENDF